MLPDANDQKILLDYIAHNVRYPGFKIPWAPVIQSAEGVGKGIIKRLLRHCIGDVYFHETNAKELAESGQKFNAWMRAKLLILADEIKVDDRRDMIEVLKPMISEEQIEVQAKGYDQKLEDNFANWIFFTNYKNAVPINANSRRFAIFYSAFQSKQQLLMWGLDDAYFNDLYGWMKGDGAAIMAEYFMNYPIEEGGVPMRAPDTSCIDEVIRNSMGSIEQLIVDAIESKEQGFRDDWISITKVQKLMADQNLKKTTVQIIEKIVAEMGYYPVGKTDGMILQESTTSRSTLFHKSPDAVIANYAISQGYMG